MTAGPGVDLIREMSQSAKKIQPPATSQGAGLKNAQSPISTMVSRSGPAWPWLNTLHCGMPS